MHRRTDQTNRSFSKNHPAQMFIMLWRHYELICQLIKRDILAKYRGSIIGLLWMILVPLLMLTIYTIVFGVFLKVRWPGVTSTLVYSLLMYTGLIILNFFSECINRSPGIIVNNANFVKKVVFPLEIYPWVIIVSAFFQAMVNSVILAFFCCLFLGKIYSTFIILPLLFLPLMLVVLGISWFLSSAGVFVRDISHMIIFIMQIIMYLSPVFYSLSIVPEFYQKILLINPLTFIIEQARSVIIYGNLPSWPGLGIYFIISLCVAYSGFVWFQRTKKGFADVL